MPSFAFTVPGNGDFVRSPALTWLRTLVLSAGSEFWCIGSGDGLLECSGATLQLRFDEHYDFTLMYREASAEPGPCWIPFYPERAEEKEPIWVGGEPIIVSSRFFVPRKLAWDAVKHFCSNGERTRRINWVTSDEANWIFHWTAHPNVELQ